MSVSILLGYLARKRATRYTPSVPYIDRRHRNICNSNAANSLVNVDLPYTNYTIPGSGVIYVGPSGNDSTGDGSVGNPYLTLGKAMTSGVTGNTIVLRGGTIYDGGISQSSSKVYTVQAYPYEKPWIDGRYSAAVSSGAFTSLGGGRWKCTGLGVTSNTSAWFNSAHPSDPAGKWVDGSANNANYIDTTNGAFAGYPDQVTYNSTVLVWAASAAAVVTGTFFIDYTQSPPDLYVGDDPSAGSVRMARYKSLLTVNAAGTLLRGIGFRCGATHRDDFGMLKINANNVTLENVVGAYAQAGDGCFIGTNKASTSIVSSAFCFNGNRGIGGDAPADLLLQYFDLEYNNWNRQANGTGRFKNWEAAGFKATGAARPRILDGYSGHNFAKGLWFDISSFDGLIARVETAFNANPTIDAQDSQGIMVEESARMKVVDAITHNNDGRGVYLSQSSDSSAVNISTHNNALDEVDLFESAQSDSPDATAIAAGVTMNTTGGKLYNSILSKPASGLAAAHKTLLKVQNLRGPVPAGTGASSMLIGEDYTLGFRGDTTLYDKFATLRDDGASSDTVYASLATYIAALPGRGPNSSEADNNASPHPYYADPTNYNFAIITGSRANVAARPLEAATCSRLGIPLRSRPDIGAFHRGRVAAPVTTSVRDTFNRAAQAAGTLGTAETGGSWTVPGTPANVLTDGFVRTDSLSAASSGFAAFLGSVSVRDVTALVRIRTTKLAVGGNLLGYIILRRSGTANYEYRARLRFDTSQVLRLAATKLEGSSTESIIGSESASLGITHAVYQWYWLKVQISGTTSVTINIKAWTDGTNEPSAWTIATTDATPHANIQVAGFPGLRSGTGSGVSNVPVEIHFDEFQVTS